VARRRTDRERAAPGRPARPSAAGRSRREPARGAARPPGGEAPPVHASRLLRICGLNAVRVLLASDPQRVERLFFAPELAGALATERAAVAAARRPYREADSGELARIAGTEHHGGVVAIARPRPLMPFEPAEAARWAGDGLPLLILDGVGNPHNVGAIARSAAYFGLTRLVFAERPDQALPSDASYRVAEGGLDALALYRAKLPAALAALKPAYRVVGTVPGRGEAVARQPAGKPVALVLGNEETGLDRKTLAACDAVATIPGSGRVQSLNVSAAAAVLIYALTRG